MPTARNARGVDIIAYSRDASRFVGVQVKALSKRNPVPLGTSLDKVMGDFWIIVNKVATAPSAYINLLTRPRSRATVKNSSARFHMLSSRSPIASGS